MLLRRGLIAVCLWLSMGLSLASDIDPQVLAQEILERTNRVESFQFIAKEARKLKVQIYLFGGSAAAFAHYVHWDLMREAGDTRFFPDRFTYSYVDIFRSNQDMDLVVDGDAEQAKLLSKMLAEKFPFFQGKKSVWEVRPLRVDMDDKQALLNNPDFLNQHTDSNSTGLIELSSDSRPAEIRDLRDWENTKLPQFLQDVQEQKLHYYYSESHHTTSRFQKGMNPPILSVIRYLTKAFQYELAIDPATKSLLKSIIADFDYYSVTDGYVKSWINNNGKKLYQNAVNLEYAAQVLAELGLKEKLMHVGSVSDPEQLAWWMNKEPLQTRPLGLGSGQTAAELGIAIVAHETNNFSAWESITKSHENFPNVFISRSGGNGETASFGDGFYTRIGRQGARYTGITIRFRLHPSARLGTDFDLVGDYVIIKNKSALTVIHESLNWGALEFFEHLLAGTKFDGSDRAVLNKLLQKITKSSSELHPKEFTKLNSRMKDYFKNPLKHNVDMIYDQWLDIDLPDQYLPGMLEYINAVMLGLDDRGLRSYQLKLYPHWQKELSSMNSAELASFEQAMVELIKAQQSKHHQYSLVQDIPTLLEVAIERLDRQIVFLVLDYLFLKPQSRPMTEVLGPYLGLQEKVVSRIIAERIFSNPVHQLDADLLLLVIEKADQTVIEYLVRETFSKPRTQAMPELLKLLIKKSQPIGFYCFSSVFDKPHSQNMTEALKLLIDRSGPYELNSFAVKIFSEPHAEHWYEYIKLAINKADEALLMDLAGDVFSKPHTKNMQDLIWLMIEKSNKNSFLLSRLMEQVFSKPHAVHMSELIRFTIEKGESYVLRGLAYSVFSKPHTAHMLQELELLIKNANLHTLSTLAEYTFSKPHTKNMQELVKLAISKSEGDSFLLQDFARYVFSKPHAAHMQEALYLLFEQADVRVLRVLMEETFSQAHSDQMPKFKRLFAKLEQLPQEAWLEHVKRELPKLRPKLKSKHQCLRKGLIDLGGVN